MLDKGQIKDWDGTPEGGDKPEAAAVKTSIANAIFAPRQAIATGERVTLTPEQVNRGATFNREQFIVSGAIPAMHHLEFWRLWPYLSMMLRPACL